MRFLVFILFLIFPCLSISQVHRCSTDEYRQVLKLKGLTNNDKHIDHIDDAQTYSSNYDIPVVIHVLYNNEDQNISDARVFSQIETLNNDYNSLNIELDDVPEEFQNVIGTVGFNFCLVQEDLNGNSFTGINRVYTNIESFQGFSDDMKKSDQGGVDAWDTENYLNIWVCDLNGNTLGFSTMPGDDPDIDGVVIDYQYFGVDLSSTNPYNLGRTGTHELGHYFNLEHTFYAGCSDWDGCDDTPALQSPTYGCPSYPQEACQSNNMTMNYMDYTNDACMSMFTICQAERMIDALLNYRSNLIASTSCSVSLNDVTQANDISIYPNPIIDFLHINIKNSRVSISDISGRMLFNNYIIADQTLDVSFLPPGTYFLSINTNTYQFIKK